MYIYLALFQYRYLRVPDYKERVLIEHLAADFKKFCVHSQALSEKDPNNLMLNKIRTFFEIHYKKLREVLETP